MLCIDDIIENYDVNDDNEPKSYDDPWTIDSLKTFDLIKSARISNPFEGVLSVFYGSHLLLFKK